MMQTKFFNIIPGDAEVAILLYGDVGEYDKVDSSRVVSELLALSAQYKKIDVRINSCGGDVFSGMAIYNALRMSKADITIYVDGVAASIAGIIALCGKPLYMSPYAKLMLHSVSGGAWGNASELRRTAQMIESLEKDLAGMIAGRCGMSAEEVAEKYFDEVDHWISAKEALEMKLIDGIYDMPGENVPENNDEIYKYFNNRLQNRQPFKNNSNMTILERLKSIPSFANIADEEAAVRHIRDLENKAVKVEALEKVVNEQKEKLQNIEEKEIGAIIDKAIAEGRIGNEQKAAFTALMKSDRANTEQLIGSMKPRAFRRAVNDIQDTPVNSLAGMSWDELDRAGKLSDLRNADFELFKNKYKEKFQMDYKD